MRIQDEDLVAKDFIVFRRSFSSHLHNTCPQILGSSILTPEQMIVEPCVGYLEKRGHFVSTNYNRRYCVLEAGWLKTYDRHSANSPTEGEVEKRSVRLKNAQLKPINQDKKCQIDIASDSGDDTHFLADSPIDAMRWREALVKHIDFANSSPEFIERENEEPVESKSNRIRASIGGRGTNCLALTPTPGFVIKAKRESGKKVCLFPPNSNL
jgi:hypothetical protein